MGDHIGYRYEILTFLGKGSFGTVSITFHLIWRLGIKMFWS